MRVGKHSLDIAKSSRHSSITGRFAEALVLYWLSRDGFECARIDHTGIDLLANNCRTGELMGISVKSRSRFPGTESVSLTWKTDHVKVDRACEAFRCNPYYAIVVDAGNQIRLFIVSKRYLMTISKPGKGTLCWGMSEKHLDKYRNDPQIQYVEFTISTESWWKERRAAKSLQ